MASYRLCLVFVILAIKTSTAYGDGQIIKSSLTFVIDDTASMWDEIKQLKEAADLIFEKVQTSNTSQIENFVLVTFNDPDATLQTITKNKDTFKSTLDHIRVNGGGDCPEYAMTGIELGLTNSLPRSYLYVFTDASAKDYDKFEQIVSQRKRNRVSFILTGSCGSPTDAEYQVYDQVAQATGGQVFRMMKDDVKDILKYIEETITGRGVSIVNRKYPPGIHKVKFNIDVHTGDVLISLSGLGSKIGTVTGPGDIILPAEPIVSGKNKMAVKKLSNVKPGDYEVEIQGGEEVHIIITAKSYVNYQLGFSTDRPSSIEDTVSGPPLEGNTFLGVKLIEEGIELTSVEISYLNNTVVEELLLTIVDGKEQFYITPSFEPPSDFFVNVIGKDLKTGSSVKRTGTMPFVRQAPSETDSIVNTAPEVTILGAPKIIAEHDAPLKLKCFVRGYPAPDIIWSEEDTGIVMPSMMIAFEVPYDFVSILDINKANKNVSYKCKASNRFGETSRHIEVEIKK